MSRRLYVTLSPDQVARVLEKARGSLPKRLVEDLEHIESSGGEVLCFGTVQHALVIDAAKETSK